MIDGERHSGMPQARKPTNLSVHVEEEELEGPGLCHVHPPFFVHDFISWNEAGGIPSPAKKGDITGMLDTPSQVKDHN